MDINSLLTQIAGNYGLLHIYALIVGSGSCEKLYGESGSSYQGQGLKLSKHFAPWG